MEITITLSLILKCSDLEQKIARMISENYQGNHTTAGGKELKPIPTPSPAPEPTPIPSPQPVPNPQPNSTTKSKQSN